ncbi:MAG: DoxX family protein [Aliihoeflea sp.]|uniref:DoxX family protein n=1 Tax=Aliihoeflea sp. TaxID=2608088 RepID=UPI004037ABFF
MPIKIGYWVFTLLFTGFYAYSVFGYVTDYGYWASEYERLGYPAYMVGVMIPVKLAGIVAILARRPIWLAQLAYAGFFYHLLLATNAHFQLGEGATVLPLVLLAFVISSWATQNGAREQHAAYAPTWR